MWLRRGKGEACLRKWEENLLSGRFTTDQESLDSAEKQGACPNLLNFPTRHLLFAKDYIAMIFTSGQTFIHLTAAGRPEDTDYFYREVVVPYMRNSLHPPLNPLKLLKRKMCSVAKLPSGGFGPGVVKGENVGVASSASSTTATGGAVPGEAVGATIATSTVNAAPVVVSGPRIVAL